MKINELKCKISQLELQIQNQNTMKKEEKPKYIKAL